MVLRPLLYALAGHMNCASRREDFHAVSMQGMVEKNEYLFWRAGRWASLSKSERGAYGCVHFLLGLAFKCIKADEPDH